MKKLLISLHGFIGTGALFGGLGAILSPSGDAMGISTETLENSPFTDFLIPGLFLFFVIGIGNIICTITVYKKVKLQAYLTGGFGLILVMWIVIQCYMLRDINILHVIYFILGLILCYLGLIIALKKKLFPFNIMLNEDNK